MLTMLAALLLATIGIIFLQCRRMMGHLRGHTDGLCPFGPADHQPVEFYAGPSDGLRDTLKRGNAYFGTVDHGYGYYAARRDEHQRLQFTADGALIMDWRVRREHVRGR